MSIKSYRAERPFSMKKQLVNKFICFQTTYEFSFGNNTRFVEVKAEIDIVVGYRSYHDVVVVIEILYSAVGVNKINPSLTC